ncbi:MAG: hypothetical protein LUH52_02995, partial [Bacteroides uniformis]|nr:hypothetical protein [Bacteroides uniformis]
PSPPPRDVPGLLPGQGLQPSLHPGGRRGAAPAAGGKPHCAPDGGSGRAVRRLPQLPGQPVRRNGKRRPL